MVRTISLEQHRRNLAKNRAIQVQKKREARKSSTPSSTGTVTRRGKVIYDPKTGAAIGSTYTDVQTGQTQSTFTGDKKSGIVVQGGSAFKVKRGERAPSPVELKQAAGQKLTRKEQIQLKNIQDSQKKEQDSQKKEVKPTQGRYIDRFLRTQNLQSESRPTDEGGRPISTPFQVSLFQPTEFKPEERIDIKPVDTRPTFQGQTLTAPDTSTRRQETQQDIKGKRLTPIEAKELTRSKITKLEKPKTVAAKISRATSKNIYQSQTSTSPTERILRGTLVASLLGTAQGVASVGQTLKNPIKEANNLIDGILTPKQTAKNIINQFIENPAGTAAQYYTYSKTLDLTGKAVKNSPVGRAISQEIFINNQPKPIQPYIRDILKSSKAQSKVKTLSKNKIDFTEVKTLTPIEAKALNKALKNTKTDSVVFGSAASRTLSGKKTPKPKDVDIATSNIQQLSRDFLSQLPKKQRANYKLKGEKLIRVSDGTAIFDVKPIERLIPNKNFITRKGELPVAGYGYVVDTKSGTIIPIKKKLVQGKLSLPTQKILNRDGIKLIGFGEQTTRKGLGTLQVLIEKNAKRAKDPQSFIYSLEIQLSNIKKATPKTQVGKLLNKQKINTIENALKNLKSKQFMDLLNKQVPGLTKNYPILDANKIKTALKNKKYNIKNGKVYSKSGKLLNDLKVQGNKIIDINTGKTILNTQSILPSNLVSGLPKFKSSDIPSILPSNLKKIQPSRLPKIDSSTLPKLSASQLKQIPVSKLPKIINSQIPKLSASQLQAIPQSKIPKLTTSTIPKLIPSQLQAIQSSKIPQISISKLPKTSVSKIPSGKIRKITTIKPPPKISKKLLDKIEKEIEKKKKKDKDIKFKYRYTPTLAGMGIKASRTGGKFTGYEIRGNIINLNKPIKVKKHKRKTLKNKNFVRRHRRRKPRK